MKIRYEYLTLSVSESRDQEFALKIENQCTHRIMAQPRCRALLALANIQTLGVVVVDAHLQGLVGQRKLELLNTLRSRHGM